MVTAIVAVGLCAPAPAAAVLHDAVRDAITRRIDAAAGAAAHVHSGRIVAVTLAGVPAVVVSRNATLAAVRAAVPRALRHPRAGVWELDRLLVVTRGATLSVSAPDVRELRLLSDGDRFATLVGSWASLRFVGERGRTLLVHSWDVRRQAPDVTLRDGRGSISVRGGGRLDASDTSFEDLGFFEGRVSGVAVTSSRRAHGTDPPLVMRPTGTLIRSRFVRNVFGAYSYEAYGMHWLDDAFVDNMIYGLDPHDNSDRFLVEDNVASGNGRHGIIFSRFCDDNVIADNRVFRNGWHGIVIDDGKNADGSSNRNRIVDNAVHDNGNVGISIDGSSQNVVTGNDVARQRYGVRVFRRSFGNVVSVNQIAQSRDYGVFVDGARRTRVTGNSIVRAFTGVRLRNAGGTSLIGNVMVAMQGHGVKADGGGPASAGTVVSNNTISGRGTSPILSNVGHGALVVQRNAQSWNYPFAHDLARTLAWFVGPGVWLLLLVAVTLGSLPGALRSRLRSEPT